MAKKSTIKVGEVSTLIVSWLKDYAAQANANGFVVGISGGIDSAVTSTLCAQTGLTTLCVEMPIHQDSTQVNRGKEHIEQLKKRFPNVKHEIVDLTSVFALGEYLKIPESIQNAAPTDGLFGDSRTDEDQLGASYDELEWAMLEVEKNKTTEDFTGREKEVFDIFNRLNSANKHKMDPIPVCIIPTNLKKL